MVVNYLELVKNNPEYFKQFSCKELLFLNYDCPVKETKLAKWSEHNYFYYVLTGQKNFSTPKNTWELKKGSFVFVKKGACVIEQYFQEPFCIVVFVMPDVFISRFISTYKDQLPLATRPDSGDLIIPLSEDDALKVFCSSIMTFFTSPVKPSEGLIELKFNELLLHLANNPENAEFISYLHFVANSRETSVQNIMEANFSYNLDLDAYAKLCNRSLSSFKRDFQHLYKITPGKWLLSKRLEFAQKLLLTTNKPLGDIVFDAGFENQAHFSRVFKEKVGVSPLQYRKQSLVSSR
jgi:AraC family transcriptional regulator, exoenzyme S synthesis regulatory protein ExsA